MDAEFPCLLHALRRVPVQLSREGGLRGAQGNCRGSKRAGTIERIYVECCFSHTNRVFLFYVGFYHWHLGRDRLGARPEEHPPHCDVEHPLQSQLLQCTLWLRDGPSQHKVHQGHAAILVQEDVRGGSAGDIPEGESGRELGKW